MIKCEVIVDFNLKAFDKIKNIVRKTSRNEYGKLYIGDRFECDESTFDYLTGNNDDGYVVVKMIELKQKKSKKEKEELEKNL